MSLDSRFKITERGSTLSTELISGITTFATLAYILLINPQILAKTGMDFGAVMTATCLTAAAATILMGLYSDFPFALAPGMGLNAFFTYSLVLKEGYTWQEALAICFLSGAFLLILNFFGIREAIMEAIPKELRIGTVAGIGLFIMYIGLKDIQLIVAHPETFTSSGNLSVLTVWLALGGVAVIAALLYLQVKGAILIGILLTFLLGLIAGKAELKGLLSLPPSLESTFFALDFRVLLEEKALYAAFSLTLINIFDASGTFLGLLKKGGYLKDPSLPKEVRSALYCDGAGTVLGSFLGTSPITIYLESMAGIAQGGRTGIVSLTVALLFLLSLFFLPLASSIPSFATAPALIIIGCLMLHDYREIPADDPSLAVPAAFTALSIPLTYSIGTGIGLGFILYTLIKLLLGKWRDLSFVSIAIALAFLFKFIFLSF